MSDSTVNMSRIYSTNPEAVRKRIQRQKRRDALGDDAFKKQLAETRRMERAKARQRKIAAMPAEEAPAPIVQTPPKPTVVSKPSDEDEEVVIKGSDKIKGKSRDAQDSTVELYWKRLAAYHRKIFAGKEMKPRTVGWLKDFDTVSNKLREAYPNDKTYWTSINAISAILGRVKGMEDLHNKYSALNVKLRGELDDERKKSILSEADKDNFVPYPTIQATLPKVNNVNDKALFSVYTLLTPRRLEDYFRMKVTKNEQDTEDKTHNWLVVDKANKPLKIVYNKYKTSRVHGTFVNNKLPSQLKTTLKAFIDKNNISSGQFLFGKSSRPTKNDPTLDFTRPDTADAFSKRLSTVMLRYTGKRVTLRLLRIGASSAFNNSGKPKSEHEREEFAKAMGHTVRTNLTYSKINAD